MGIFCEIRLFPSSNGVYRYASGSVVSGAIKYVIDEEDTFKTLTVSLKGQGRLKWIDKRRRREKKKFRYNRQEDYVDDNVIIYTNEREDTFKTGQYEAPFSFQIPQGVPPSLTLTKTNARFKLRCDISYYICMKFERPGLLNLSKDFKKDITVISGDTPRLAIEPLEYSVGKSLLRLKSLFSSKKETVNIKGSISTSVVGPNETIRVVYEIENNTSVEIKSVKIKLIEEDEYRPGIHRVVKKKTRVDGTYQKHGVIKAGEIMNFLYEVSVPDHCGSINHSKMINRDYFLGAIVVLPMPHSNLNLKIPVQVMDKNTTQIINTSVTVPEYPTENPPTYWEAMSQEIQGRIDNGDEDFNDEKIKS